VAEASVLITAAAFAQVPPTDLDSELFHTAVDARHTTWTDDAERPEDTAVFAGATSFYAHRPLIYTFPTGSEVAVVSSVFRTDLTGGIAWQGLRGAVLVPLSWTAGSEVQDGGGTGLGDLALDGKVVFVDPEDAPVGLAATARLQLPTTGLDLPLGAPGPVGSLAVVASGDLGPLGFAANLGPRLAPRSELGDATLDDALDWRLAVVAPLGDSAVALEGAGRLGFGSPLSATSPAELLLGAQTPLPSDLTLRGGASLGLGGAVGVPAFRVVVGLTWMHPLADRPDAMAPLEDRDSDGVVDGDVCATAPEDRDGFEDADGCPDQDDDADGVVDGLDACRTEPEDRDGWRDDDGCPDPKTRVGVRVTSATGGTWPAVEVNVVCGAFTRTVSADQAIDVEPGPCTFSGGGAGGVPAFTKAVEVGPGAAIEVELPLEVPGPSGMVQVAVRSADGGVVEQAAWSFDGGRALRVSGEAQAILPPGSHEVKVFAQGYTDHVETVTVAAASPAQLVVALAPLPAWLARGRVLVARPLEFTSGTAALGTEDSATVAAIAKLLAEHPEVVRLRVEVHTGPAGDAAANQLLSDERGLVLRDALVAAGVATERIAMVGFGESRPIPSNTERVDLWADTAP
jgi:outer membrane protein OmpA-like peptidoglycan-associated protein